MTSGCDDSIALKNDIEAWDYSESGLLGTLIVQFTLEVL